MFNCKTLDEFLLEYGTELGQAAEDTMAPLHVPGRDSVDRIPKLLRKPFEAQKHVVVANAKLLNREKACGIIAECGAGKTIMAQATVETHQAMQNKRWHKKSKRQVKSQRAYRAIVMCPGTLVMKWQREILETIPKVRVVVIRNYRQMIKVHKREGNKRRPGATWYIIGRDTAKLSCGWKPKRVRRQVENHRPWAEAFIRCPKCGKIITDKDGTPRTDDWLKKRRQSCLACGEQLWQDVASNKRNPKYSPALYIKQKMKGFFDYFVIDEAHEAKSPDSIQATAMGYVASASKKVIALTGTLIGGYAWHVRTLLFRMGLGNLVLRQGMSWKDEMSFNEKYGRTELKITEIERDDDDEGYGYSQGRGSKSTRKAEYARPGLVPTMFGDLLVNNFSFLSLDEVAADLKPYVEDVVSVPLDGELAVEYDRVEKALSDAVSVMLRNGNKKLLGTMLAVLLCYPDHPFGWQEVGYHDKDSNSNSGRKIWIPVIKPQNLDSTEIYPKEEKLLEDIMRENREGRQCWVYTTFTGKRDVAGRLERIIREKGLRVKVLRATVSPEKREEWINTHGPNHDVIISHPELVKTGLDFFSKDFAHNFPSIMFYETGYNLFTLAQASRRAWRIGQRRECRTYYYVYEGTMQARAMALMGEKACAAQALTGKFSSEGLAAMGGDDDNLEMVLAQQLAERTSAGDPTRAWEKITTSIHKTEADPNELASLQEALAGLDLELLGVA